MHGCISGKKFSTGVLKEDFATWLRHTASREPAASATAATRSANSCLAWFERQAADQPVRLETECDVSGAVRRYRLHIGRQPHRCAVDLGEQIIDLLTLGGSQLLEDLKDDRNLRIAYPGVQSGEVEWGSCCARHQGLLQMFATPTGCSDPPPGPKQVLSDRR
jgi:hypothetical protein